MGLDHMYVYTRIILINTEWKFLALFAIAYKLIRHVFCIIWIKAELLFVCTCVYVRVSVYA